MLYILALFATLAFAQTADLAVTGARIYTADPAHPTASAIAVKNGNILAVGDDITRYMGASTRRIDAKGATIIPGLIDSHVHMQGLGDSLEILDLRDAKSEQQIADMVRKATHSHRPGEWIRGRVWDQNKWP